MKNITLKIDEATYDRARLEAARRKTSVSGLVREYFSSLDSGEDREARRVAALRAFLVDRLAISLFDSSLKWGTS